MIQIKTHVYDFFQKVQQTLKFLKDVFTGSYFMVYGSRGNNLNVFGCKKSSNEHCFVNYCTPCKVHVLS